jgi:RHS repeat-associated protein
VITDKTGTGTPGVIDVRSNTAANEILQENHYYAFGMAYEGNWLMNDAGVRDNAYQYNGKEINADFGLNWNDYGARWYDPAIGRWNGVDAMAANMPTHSPFIYGFNNPIRLIDPDGNAPVDPILDFSALKKNPEYQGLTTKVLRQAVQAENSNLEQWQVNISAGVALENAYAEFSGFTRSSNQLSQKGDTPLALRVVRPDFFYATEVLGGDKSTLVFLRGGIVEVKAPQNAIDLTTNSSQIDAEMNLARYADATNGVLGNSTQAHQVKGGSFTLVLTAGSKIEQRVIDEATRRGVNLYVQYAFQHNRSGKVVFSNPQKLNNISNHVNDPRSANGTSPNGVMLNFPRSILRWEDYMFRRGTNNSSDE